MRRFLLIAALVLMAGCSVEPTTEPVVPEGVEPSLGHIFHATIEGEEESRVYLDNKIRIRWNADDLITIFEGTTRNRRFKLLDAMDGDNSAEFEPDYKPGFGSGNPIDCYYALYPYASTTKYVYGEDEGVEDYLRYTLPSSQNYKVGSIGDDANVMVAVTADLDDFDLLFRNVCSFLRVKLYGVDQSVKSVVFSGNDGEAVAGAVAITPVYGDVPTMRMLDTERSVTLECPAGVDIATTREEATEFWLVVPAQTYSKGYTVTVNGFFGGSQSFSVTASRTFARNTYNTITRELTIEGNGAGIGVGGWGDGGSMEGTAE